MTPYQESELSTFRVLRIKDGSDHSWGAGTLVELIDDDGTHLPQFKRFGTDGKHNMDWHFIHIDDLEPTLRGASQPQEKTQTKSELFEENKSLSKQVKRLSLRRELLRRELDSLDTRIARKKKFIQENKKEIRGAV